jgi:hypothetical protein
VPKEEVQEHGRFSHLPVMGDLARALTGILSFAGWLSRYSIALEVLDLRIENLGDRH